ncbi:helix-turn-helix transcriptional regulator [Tolypothrix sp. VBCCA 56010]|uniref:AraC family transcriptional regulator n=1 Tax=Tolypothrix sp. VBCCA 56010 TaxID=3137731 RepID=UPI003D7E6B93
MSPELLKTFFPTENGDISPVLKFLAKGDNWQSLIYPETTTAIEAVAQQIINCPYHGMTKRMYLQGKIQELMALQLAPILADQCGLQPSPQLKSSTIARIHYAREILLSRLENPPSLVELGELVGVSDRTILRGFKDLFGTTVVGYITEKRLNQAQEWLRSGNYTVAEVANLVGYTNPAHFATAFKRQFGIAPSECLLGKKSV